MAPIVAQGLELAIIGMGTVFFFLTFLVFAIMLMSWLVNSQEQAAPPGTPEAANNRKLAAISAAIHQHRNK